MNTGDQKYKDEFKDGTSKLGPYEDEDIASNHGITLTIKIQKILFLQLQWIWINHLKEIKFEILKW